MVETGNVAGVHPSVVAVEADEADNESSSEDTSSSNNTLDYADAEPGPSDLVDMSSLPEESLDDGSLASNGAILVDDVIRAAQDQIQSTSQLEVSVKLENSPEITWNSNLKQEDTCKDSKSSKTGSISQTSANQSTEPGSVVGKYYYT